MNTSNITFLGPLGTTFTHEVYCVLAKMYGAPIVTKENYIPASKNAEVLQVIENHGGYGAIAMETLAEARVDESVNSFLPLLRKYKNSNSCPIQIAGAIRMRLHFCLMARPGVSKDEIVSVIAHNKSFGACRKKVEALKVPLTEVPNNGSNGEAARLVAQDEAYAKFASLGPRCAALEYGLEILEPEFEDEIAVTTFFLIAPKVCAIKAGAENRMLVVWNAIDRPGSLRYALEPLEKENLNMIHINSVHVGNRTYDFICEVEGKDWELPSFNRAMSSFADRVNMYLQFGPFEIVDC